MGDQLLQLRQLQTLRVNGTITEDEFNQMKKDILSGENMITNTSDSMQILAKKKIWAAILWAIFFPVGAYAYTRRWKPLFILLGCLMVTGFFIGAVSEDEEESFTNSFLFGSFASPLISGIDNGTAISRARELRKARCDDRI